MSLKDIIYKGVETVSVLYPEREAREMVFAYLEDALGIKRYTHVIEPDYLVADDSVAEAVEAFRRMASGEPLQYITGSAWFYGRKFRVTPDVLIPRPETELLCNNSKPVNGICPAILDLCTGSGCIAWTLALEIPDARVTAVDISEGALSVASSQDFSEEIARTGAMKPVFVKADVLADSFVTTLSDNLKGCVPGQSSGSVPLQFDLIVSNPPYVMDSEKPLMRPNVLDHEPHLALFVPDDDPLKFYRAIASHAVRLLSADGFGIVEINEALGWQTAGIFRSAGFHVHVMQDLSGKDRFVRFSRKFFGI